VEPGETVDLEAQTVKTVEPAEVFSLQVRMVLQAMELEDKHTFLAELVGQMQVAMAVAVEPVAAVADQAVVAAVTAAVDLQAVAVNGAAAAAAALIISEPTKLTRQD